MPIPFPAAIPAVTSILGGIFNKKKAPATAPFIPVDVGDEQKKAVESNLGAQDDIEQLLERANKFSQGQASSLMEQALPGFGNLQKKFMETSAGLLDDPYNLPKDVEQNLARLAAERGISAGTRGQFNDFSLLRDFGINQLQYGASRIGQAQSVFSTLAQLAPRVNPLSPMSFYVTPDTAIQTQMQNRVQQQAVQQGANNAQAAASNWNRQNLWQGITDAVMMGSSIFGSPRGNLATSPAQGGDINYRGSG